jgi:hypothetical protein
MACLSIVAFCAACFSLLSPPQPELGFLLGMAISAGLAFEELAAYTLHRDGVPTQFRKLVEGSRKWSTTIQIASLLLFLATAILGVHLLLTSTRLYH